MPENKLDFAWLKEIHDASLYQFTKEVVEIYHTFDNHIEFQKEIQTADKALSVLFDILEEKQIFDRERKPYNTWVEVLISAVYLYYAVHNRLKDDSFIELFKIRQNHWDTAERCGMNRQTFDILCQAVEAGNGTTGVPACKPVPGTPTELMALSIFFVEKILPKYEG